MDLIPERQTLGGRAVLLCGDPDAPTLLVQPADVHDLDALAEEIAHIRALAEGIPFCLAAFQVDDAYRELSPWPAPPIFGAEAFAGCAGETLDWLDRALLPALAAGRRRACIGGYSLAGLFALYAACEREAFAGAAGVSPSVWFPGWLEYIRDRAPRAGKIYLSLGDREERARNPVLRAVGDNIRAMYARLDGTGSADAVLEWNPGNHFRDPALRTAKGFAWLLKALE